MPTWGGGEVLSTRPSSKSYGEKRGVQIEIEGGGRIGLTSRRREKRGKSDQGNMSSSAGGEYVLGKSEKLVN